MEFHAAAERYLAQLLRSGVVTAEAGDASTQSVVEAWAMLRFVQKAVEDRMAALRNVLLDRAERSGKPTEKGGQKLVVGGTTVLREKRLAALPDEATIRGLLEERGLKTAEAFTSVTKVVLDASKVQNLIALGKLPEAEVEAAKKVTYALRVKEAPELLEALDRVAGTPGREG